LTRNFMVGKSEEMEGGLQRVSAKWSDNMVCR
jgi:hypothetical protein